MPESPNVFKTVHLDHEPACLAPGLFQSWPKRGGNTKLEVDYVTGGLKFEFRGGLRTEPTNTRKEIVNVRIIQHL